MKSIAGDAHISSITFAVMNSMGKVLDKRTMALNEELIVDYVTGIRGEKQLTFEEGPLAEWLLNLLHDKVDRLIVCDPRENALVYKGNSNDDIDSYKLANLLRMGSLKEVVHPLSKDRQEFRMLMNLWFKIQKEKARAKNRLKALFRMNGVKCEGVRIYNEALREYWMDKLPKNSMSRVSASLYWQQIRLFEEQEVKMYQELQNKSKKFKEIKEFLKEKGVGLITAASFSAYIFTPFRFATKAKLWAYCGLSLEENDTGKKIEKEEEQKRRLRILRRLTKNGNKRLKRCLKSAAECACWKCKDGDLKRKYLECRARGLANSSAILSATRSLTVKLWGIWKRIERDKIKKTI